MFKNTNLVLATIPYDLHNDREQHKIISEINNIIRQMVYNNMKTNLLDLHLLENIRHTWLGYHIITLTERKK